MSAQNPSAEYTRRVGTWRLRRWIFQQDYARLDPVVKLYFPRRDTTRDSLLEYSPKFLYRMDTEANAALERYYAMELPTEGNILDLHA